MTRTNPYDSALQRHTRCGDIAPVEHAYFVNTSETIRVDPIYLRDVQQSDISASESESENLRGPAGLDAGGFEVPNFDGVSHAVSVGVAYRNETTTPRTFSQSHSAGEHSGIVQPGVTARKGTYNVSVRRTIYQGLCRPVFDR